MFRHFKALLLACVLSYAQPVLAFDVRVPEVGQLREYFDTHIAVLPEMPVHLRQAFVLIENPKFFESPAFRSPITLAVASLVGPDRPSQAERLANVLAISQTFGKEEILQLYLHKVFLGRGCFGVEDAAQAYFGQSVQDLTLLQIAFLAGLPVAPVAFDPERFPDRAHKRRNEVLTQLAHRGFPPADQLQTMKTQPTGFLSPLRSCRSD